MSKPVVCNGRNHNSMSALAKELGVKEKTIYDCIYTGRPVTDKDGCKMYVDYAFTIEEIAKYKGKEKVQQGQSIRLQTVKL